MILRISLLAVVALLLAAHFLRQGSLVPTALCALTPLLFAIRRRWSLIVLQVFAYFCAGIWITTLTALIQERLATQRPWIAALVILTAVTLLSLLAGVLLNSRVAKDRYPKA